MSFDFKSIIGQEDLKNYFKIILENKTISHSYIILGERLSGKKLIAKSFSKSLLCEKMAYNACNKCKSCHQIETCNNMDLIYVEHDKKDTVSVEDIRKQIIDTLYIKPYSNRYKIYIIDEAEKMTKQAQNAILKTLEEPPLYAVFLMLSTNYDKFLPTILSRCIKLKIEPIEEDKIKNYLMQEYKIPDYKAIEVAKFSGNNLGKAILSLTNTESIEEKEEFLKIIKSLPRYNSVDIHELIINIEKNKKEFIIMIINNLTLWFRDVLLYKSTKDRENILFSSELNTISVMSKTSYLKLNFILESIFDSQKRILSNVDISKVLEVLLIKIKENINA